MATSGIVTSGISGASDSLLGHSPVVTALLNIGSETSADGLSKQRPISQRRRPRSPVSPQYKQVETRRESFVGVDWPPHLNATPEKLANAGFYYVGPPDKVKCAYCGGQLRNWEPRESALGEHLKHFRHCEYARHIQRINIGKQTAAFTKHIWSQFMRK